MSGRRASRVSLIDVARRAGVSTATAGRVLGGYGYTSDEIRDRVREAAASLEYRPNRLARGLITGKTQTIGVVAADIENAFYASAIRGIADVARREGFGVIVTNSDEDLEREREAVQLLREKQVDGIIVSPCDLGKPKHLLDAIEGACPLVQLDRVSRGLDADAVVVDNVAATRACIEHLIAAGHVRIAFVAELATSFRGDIASFASLVERHDIDLPTLYPSWQRLAGYMEALRAAQLPLDLALVRRVGAYSAEAARGEVQALLSGRERPTAFFSGDGTMSTGVIKAVTEARLRIPEDLSLVCFDDLDWMEFVANGITALRQPARDMGRVAAELLLKRIQGDTTAPQRVALATTMTERNSVAPPKVE